ncbi:MAG: hypothetical protein JNG86_17915, partial [Verrucomicrobiaceae bacterium]|nr:hypothetical protein [Verrucomicrobiaceae bacterium]
MSVHRPIPAELAVLIPAECLQLVVVAADDEKATAARLWTLERDLGSAWKPVEEPFPVRIGRNGLAWGMDGPAAAEFAAARVKREGDGCSPTGVFGIPAAFGAETLPGGLKLPYTRCTQHHFGIDDVRSRFYNQIVDAREVTCDWTSPETMIPSNGCYELGAVIAHNPDNVPGAGS